MRSWVKGSIAVLLAALACAVMAPGAMAVQPPEESEGVFLEVTPRKDVQVWVEVHPQLGVAVLRTSIGMSKEGVPRPRHGSVEYAAQIPKGPLEGKLDLTIPGVASIVGALVEGGEGLEFDGSFHFTGNGGYLAFDVAHATGETLKRPALICVPRECLTPNPTLFEYVDSPFTASNFNSQILLRTRYEGSHKPLPGDPLRARRRVHLQSPDARMAAWGSRRRADARGRKSSGPGLQGQLESRAPEVAEVAAAVAVHWLRALRARRQHPRAGRGKVTGSLSADIYGVKARLAGPGANASLFNFNPGL